MKTAIIIPARIGGTRLPGKPLELIGDRPMIQCVYEQACKVSGVHEVVIATDAQEILDAVLAAGGKAVMTRSDHVSGSDRVAEAAALIDADLIVNVQGDEPFIKPADLSALVSTLHEHPGDMVTLDFPIRDHASFVDSNLVKVVKDQDNRALYFSRAPIPHCRDDATNIELARGHIGVYGYHRDVLARVTQAEPAALENLEKLEQLRALALGVKIRMVSVEEPPIGIDTPDDLAKARERVASMGSAAFPD